MSSFTTPAIILRRIDYGDNDLIISFMTLNQGKISAIAKSAKKSKKRFAGILEPFSIIEGVFSTGKGKGRLPVLQEAVLKHPVSTIRSNVQKTAYASYWAELIDEWQEEAQNQSDVFYLLSHALKELDMNRTQAAAISVLFQMRFITLSGYGPDLSHCSICKKVLEKVENLKMILDVKRGGLVCHNCGNQTRSTLSLSLGTIKQLLWIKSGTLEKAKKMKLGPVAVKESLDFLEVFVPYHLGKSPRSLTFLRNIRSEINSDNNKNIY